VDELVYQDAVASLYRRNSLLEIIQETASRIFVPLTVAGGIRSVGDVRALLRAGADKVAVNTAATENPTLLRDIALAFGSQCVVSAIDAFRRPDGRYEVWVDYGRQPTGIDVFDWARRVVDLGVGEILLTSVDRDGTGRGYDIDLIARVSAAVPIPVIACGGAGDLSHFPEAVIQGGADAVAAASMFHYWSAVPVGKPYMSYSEAQLRMGASIDSGNIDFLNHGYGGQRAIPVRSASIGQVKAALEASAISVRATDEAEFER
jgi:cyclase